MNDSGRQRAVRRLFITGASGYVGSRLLDRLEKSHVESGVVLLRGHDGGVAGLVERLGFEMIHGDLLAPSSYSDALATCETVVHLAALTGKARSRHHFRVNSEGTRALCDACVDVGVGRIVHISTIAAKFPHQRRYFYAQSKRRAELIVAASGLDYSIVRPTMVFGPGAPVLRGLSRLARLPMAPVFGDGRARVQPVFVDDLADCLIDIASRDQLGAETIEIGGPEVIEIKDLLARIRPARRRVHIPLRLAHALLAPLEAIALEILPITCGQLATFANDGTAAPSAFMQGRAGQMTGIDGMLQP